MSNRLKRPLNQSAVEAADDQFYAAHPELVQNGERIPLDPSDPKQAALRSEWKRDYLANGGETEDSDFGNSEPESTSAPCKDDDHWVEFRYVVKGADYAVSDLEPLTLIYPGGKQESVTSDGSVRRDGVPAGMYQLQPKYLSGASWTPDTVSGDETATIRIEGKNIPDGESVTIQVFRAPIPFDATPEAELTATFAGGRAEAAWSFQQDDGDAPFGAFPAIAKWKAKVITAPPLTVEAFPTEDDRGLQQRLKHLGYYTGGIDGISGPQTEDAIRQFQEDFPPLTVDGIAGPQTRGLLSDLTY